MATGTGRTNVSTEVKYEGRLAGGRTANARKPSGGTKQKAVLPHGSEHGAEKITVTPESIPPSEADGNDDPPIVRSPYRVARLSDPLDIRRDILGEELESPPGFVTPGLLDALPDALDYMPALSEAVGVVRLPEVQAAIDGVIRIALEPTADQLYAQIAPSMAEYGARLAQSMAPALTALNANMGAALYEPHRRMMDAMNKMTVQTMAQFSESFGRVDAALEEWAVSMRRSIATLHIDIAYVSRAARLSWDVDGWMKANPVWPLVYDVLTQRDDWETSLSDLAQLPEFASIVEALERRGADSYTATIIVRWVLRQAILEMPDTAPLPALLPYLQKAVQNALRGNQFPLLPGGVLLGNSSKTRRGRPVGSTAIPDSKFPAHYVAAYRRLWRNNDHRPDDGDVFPEMGISKSTFYAQKARLSNQGIELPVPSEPAPPDRNSNGISPATTPATRPL